MEILSRDSEEFTFRKIKEVMSRRIYRLIENSDWKLYPQKIVRLEVLCPDIDCLVWLSRQLSENKIYWSDRDSGFETAGMGTADLLKADGCGDYKQVFSVMRRGLNAANEYLRYYGGLSFYNKEPDQEWKIFGSYFFIVPQFEIFKAKGKTFFAFNIKTADINRAQINASLSKLNTLIFAIPPKDNDGEIPRKVSPDVSSSGGQYNGAFPEICSLRHLPDNAHWIKIFDENIRLSLNKAYAKIVLARKTVLDFSRHINPLSLFLRLKEQTNGCFHYYFQPPGDTAFLGATPERLFKRKGSQIETEAIAGTKPRGENESEDAVYEQQLFSSAKEALEHGYVVDFIKNTLSNFCLSLQFDEKSSIIKTTTAQHLITRFKGTLKEEIGEVQLLSALHPTPAVGGYPADKALKTIFKIEPFSRGWYASPVGFVGSNDADFAVALRCALVRGKNVSLFAGAGIVEGSTAEDEWREIENKNSAYMRIFGL